jgi:broad specificity phosphatase PhoE
MRSETLQAIITSPLQRALHTAEAIGVHHNLVPHEDHRLKEMHFGVAEGLTLSEAGVLHPEILTLLNDPTIADFAWPGGDRWSDFHARVFVAFADITQRFRDQSLALVAHGGVISSIVAQLDGGSPNDYETYPIANCSITHIEVTQHGTHLHRVNDIAHLDVVRTEPFTYADPTTLVHAGQNTEEAPNDHVPDGSRVGAPPRSARDRGVPGTSSPATPPASCWMLGQEPWSNSGVIPISAYSMRS